MPGSLTSGFLWSRWRGRRSRHSRRMCNPHFYVSGKWPIDTEAIVHYDCLGTNVLTQNGIKNFRTKQQQNTTKSKAIYVIPVIFCLPLTPKRVKQNWPYHAYTGTRRSGDGIMAFMGMGYGIISLATRWKSQWMNFVPHYECLNQLPFVYETSASQVKTSNR